MIKIFHDRGWRGKVNFVDDNNVLVGYDLNSSCCEQADYTITDIEGELTMETAEQCLDPDILDKYTFDKEYFGLPEGEDWLDAGGHVVFKMVSETEETLYLHLWNCQNGYYGHGFTFKDNEKIMQEGTL